MKRIFGRIHLPLWLCLVGVFSARAQVIEMYGAVTIQFVGSTVTISVDSIRDHRRMDLPLAQVALQLWATDAPYYSGLLTGNKLCQIELGEIGPGWSWDNVVRTSTFLEPPPGNYNVVCTLVGWNEFGSLIVDWRNFSSSRVFGYPPQIVSASTAFAEVGTSFYYRIVAINNPSVFAATTLPAGLGIDQSTGIISGTPSQAGTYRVGLGVANSLGSGSASLTLTVRPQPPPPLITSQPQSRTIPAGNGVTFSVMAKGTAPLSYQWYRNNSLITDATASSYTISAAQTGDAGEYKVRVSNSAGSVVSSVATLTVQSAPIIPGESLVINGGFEAPRLPNPNTAFTLPNGSTAIPGWVSVDNVPAGVDADNYHYRAPYYGHSTSEGEHFVYINNHSYPSPTLNGIYQDLATVAGQIYQVMFDAGTEIAYGTPGLLRVSAGNALIRYTLPNVNGQPPPPPPPYIFTGWSTYSFSFTASSSTTRLQFYDEGFQIGGNSATGNASPLLDNVRVYSTAPSITSQPDSRIVSAGSSVSFSVSAAGIVPFSYQWYRNNSAIAGATSDSYDINSAKPGDAGNYKVRVRNAVGAVDSASATLTVNISPSITAQPQNKIITAGNNVTFSVVAKGAGPLSYQWSRNNTAISDATGASHSLSGVKASDVGDYKVRVSNSAGGVDSIVATLTVKADAAKPDVVISSPAAARLTDPVLTLTGTVRDNVRAVTVEYRLENSQGIGTYKAATGTSNWLATIASLMPGPNTVRVRARDAAGNWSAEVTRSFTYVLLSPLALTTSGLGFVTPNLNGQRLEVGKTYTLTAMPAPGHVLSNWTGGLVGNSAKLSFAMQSNLTLRANFVTNPFIALKGSYNGLFFETNGVRLESSGFLNLALTDRGSYSGSLQMNSGRYPFSGQFGLDGEATNIVKVTGQINGLRLELTLDLSRTMTDRLMGRVVSANDGWTAELLADRAPVYAQTNGSPYLGKYTLMIPGNPGSGDIPGGYGIGTLTVAKNGRLSWSGTLGDGKLVTQSVPVSEGGYWPLFATPYRTKGSILGWVSLDTNHLGDFKTNLVSLVPTGNLAAASLALGGNLSWIKLNQPDKYYPKGFTNETLVFGSVYSLQTPVLQSGDWQVHFSGGNLTSDYVNTAFLTQNNKLTNAPPNQAPLVFQVNLANGTFSGNAKLPDSSLKGPLTFKGVVLQGLNLGMGQFFGINQSGQAALLPAILHE